LKLKPEKNSGLNGFEPMISAIPVQWAIRL